MNETAAMTQTPLSSAATDESAQTMAEYSVLVAVIALVVVLVLPQVAAPIRGFFDAAAQAIGG
jgi:Flp pilus assembly pilin Flp